MPPLCPDPSPESLLEFNGSAFGPATRLLWACARASSQEEVRKAWEACPDPLKARSASGAGPHHEAVRSRNSHALLFLAQKPGLFEPAGALPSPVDLLANDRSWTEGPELLAQALACRPAELALAARRLALAGHPAAGRCAALAEAALLQAAACPPNPKRNLGL